MFLLIAKYFAVIHPPLMPLVLKAAVDLALSISGTDKIFFPVKFPLLYFLLYSFPSIHSLLFYYLVFFYPLDIPFRFHLNHSLFP